MQWMARILIFSGLALICLGAVLLLAQKMSFPGRLPGDIYIKSEKFSFYFPLATCLLISLAASLLFRIFSRR